MEMSVYRVENRVSGSDGWARISTIKMVSHPSGQENNAKPKREEVGLFNLKVTGKNDRDGAPYGISMGVFGERVAWDYCNAGTTGKAGSGSSFGFGFGFGFSFVGQL